MKTLHLIALAAFAIPAFAADDNTARMRAGPNASSEGGATLGQTGVRSNAGDSARPETNAPAKPRPRAERKKAEAPTVTTKKAELN
jgi:hypothetical protein